MEVTDVIELKICLVDNEIKIVNEQIAACRDKEVLAYLWGEKKQLREEKKLLLEQQKDAKKLHLEKELIMLRNAAATAVPPPGASFDNAPQPPTRGHCSSSSPGDTTGFAEVWSPGFSLRWEEVPPSDKHQYT
ncbi:hypothetical protein VOLCADRAFT_90534 [Volvox carteri f. nagariensis]|uniref:Uncharacterized protein n=1 Tax=Volvox carteri f. nagariensis TaxID=3068 RepID=D8TUN1_VOLCA|nr:uncharacterized protein VOLCADRAFT_90534 [Volvox carteri f. nagariensis]EFJ48853.1 hypothetical protein VOLCADRAFT_90534 [Volvox carteri f. nagariensis]|eukprot:XP_002950185.1 hypothetical protein VOLCADRAFT_90534 [Volvox carteri f. nagariensis]